MKQRREKVDLSRAPSVGTSLADKLRSKGLAPAAPPAPSPETAPGGSPPPQRRAPKAPAPALDAGPVAPEGPLASLPKVVLRMERKGHGGKTVTVVEGLASLGGAALEALAKRLAKGLGCGARAEQGAVVLQGDHRERAATLLAREGARRIVAG